MRKAIAMLLGFAMLFSSFFVMLDMNVEGKDITPASMFTGAGSGTAADPYQITNVDELQEMNLNLSANYTLMNNIDASATTGWPGGEGFEPIGDFTARFNGTLDGQNFKIINLFIDRIATNNVGLFGYVNDTGIIQNVILEFGDITGQSSVGSIAGTNIGSLVNCHSWANVSGLDMIGGFLGTNNGDLMDCSSHGSVDGTNDDIGGFVGIFEGEAFNCSATGKTSGINRVGGFIGYVHSGRMENCRVSGEVTGNEYIGGFAGDNTGEINTSYSTGNVIGTGNNIGGFAGIHHFGGTITRSYSTGDASGSSSNIGGFVGRTEANITYCYSYGTAIGFFFNGGFAGYVSGGTIESCFSTGNTGDIVYSDYSGGFLGRLNIGTVNGCYSTGKVQGETAMGGFAGSISLGTTTTECYSTGDVTGRSMAGGFVGNFQGGLISKSYSTGDIIGINVGQYFGGFVGESSGTISDCFSRGNVYAPSQNSIGGFNGIINAGSITNCYSTGNPNGAENVTGFCGYSDSGTITDCFWDTETSGEATSAGGAGVIGKTTAEMKQQATFDPPWDFTAIWGIVEDTIYPCFIFVNPIVTTSHLSQPEIAYEKSNYVIDFDAVAQPVPSFNYIDWSIETNSTGWLSIDSMGVVSGIPTNADVGTWYVNVSANDSLGSKGNFNFTVSVLNTDPAITTSNILTAINGTLYSVDYGSTDDPTTTWALSSNATWLIHDSVTGMISGTPLGSQTGTYWVNVSVDDGNGGVISTNFTLTVILDTDGDGDPNIYDIDDDDDGTIDTHDDFPLDSTLVSDIDSDGIDDSDDLDNDNDGWNDTIEITGGFDPLDNTSMPGDADSDGIADFMDPDFLTSTEYNNETLYSNNTVWNNATADLGVDSDSDGWNDLVEILAGTDHDDDTDTPSDTDSDGIADFMDPDFLTLTTEVPIYNNNTIWNNGTADPRTVTETPIWAWGAVIAAVVMGVLTLVIAMRGGSKPEPVEEVPEPELEEPNIEKEETE